LRHAIVCLLLVLLAGIASADELILNNGDRLTGKVLGLVGGVISFKPALAGEVKIAVSDIRSLSTEGPVKVVLPDRSVVNEPLAVGEPGRVRIGDRDLALAELRAINPPGARWTGKAGLGVSLINATQDDTKIDFLLNMVRMGTKARFALDAGYFYGRSEEETTTDNWFVGGEYNFARSGRVYAVANARVQSDKIQNLDLRTILGGGLGYIASDRPDWKFRAEGGLAWLRTSRRAIRRATLPCVWATGWRSSSGRGPG
jgi:hypothetical protein